MIHSSTASLLHEAIPEMLHVAQYCLATKKPNGGCYGYPLVVLLFSIVDTIGSYYSGADYPILIDGKERKIIKTSQHYYILNSSYYGQSFTLHEIEKLYDNFRSLLTHNLAMPPDHFLSMDEPMAPLLRTSNQSRFPILNVTAFARLSAIAVEKFLLEIDSVVSLSKQATNISKKTF